MNGTNFTTVHELEVEGIVHETGAGAYYPALNDFTGMGGILDIDRIACDLFVRWVQDKPCSPKK